MPSASDGDPSDYMAARPNDRPLLLPNGRKLRHLGGLSLRNLAAAARPRSVISLGDEPLSPREELQEEELAAGRRLSLRRRRRSTKLLPELAGIGPRHWEGVVNARRADAFFSLHVDGVDEPVYVSEIVKQYMNPDFQGFDLNQCGPTVSRQDRVTVRVWATLEGQWRLLLDYDVQLAGLRYIGKSLENFRHPLPQNCIVFYLSDGCYTFFDSAAAPPPALSAEPTSISSTSDGDPKNLLPTSSRDALMQLSTLEECIYDAASTTASLTERISNLCETNRASLSINPQLSTLRARLSDIRKASATERRRLAAARQRRDTLKLSIQTRREAMEAGRASQRVGETYLSDAGPRLARSRADVAATAEAIEAARRRIVSDLGHIYPVEPVEGGGALEFKILGAYLPNAGLEDQPATTAAALGYVASVVYMLSFYLGVALRYPIARKGSNSFIQDPVGTIQGARSFQLNPSGTALYRFEYAVFLLNKDIEQLLAARGIRVVDIRHTLPNLKNLMLAVALGSGESAPSVVRAQRSFASTLGHSRAPSIVVSKPPSPDRTKEPEEWGVLKRGPMNGTGKGKGKATEAQGDRGKGKYNSGLVHDDQKGEQEAAAVPVKEADVKAHANEAEARHDESAEEVVAAAAERKMDADAQADEQKEADDQVEAAVATGTADKAEGDTSNSESTKGPAKSANAVKQSEREGGPHGNEEPPTPNQVDDAEGTGNNGNGEQDEETPLTPDAVAKADDDQTGGDSMLAKQADETREDEGRDSKGQEGGEEETPVKDTDAAKEEPYANEKNENEVDADRTPTNNVSMKDEAKKSGNDDRGAPAPEKREGATHADAHSGEDSDKAMAVEVETAPPAPDPNADIKPAHHSRHDSSACTDEQRNGIVRDLYAENAGAGRAVDVGG